MRALEGCHGLAVRQRNLGTAALENPEWTRRAIDRFGDRIAVGLDVRGTTLAARGWTQEGGDTVEPGRLEVSRCSRYVVPTSPRTAPQGPNLDLLRQRWIEKTGRPVVATGGHREPR